MRRSRPSKTVRVKKGTVLDGAAIAVLQAAGLGSVIAIVAPAMFDEFRDLQGHLPEYAQDLEDFMSGFGFETERWDLPERADEIDWTIRPKNGSANSSGSSWEMARATIPVETRNASRAVPRGSSRRTSSGLSRKA